MGGLLLENFNDSVIYLGIKFRIVKRIMDVDIDHRLRKFNAAAFNIIMNSKDLTEVVRSGLIDKKMFAPIAVWYGFKFDIRSELL